MYFTFVCKKLANPFLVNNYLNSLINLKISFTFAGENLNYE